MRGLPSSMREQTVTLLSVVLPLLRQRGMDRLAGVWCNVGLCTYSMRVDKKGLDILLPGVPHG